MAHSFIKLHKTVIHVIILASFLCLWFSSCALWWMRRGLWKLPDGRDWLWEKLGLAVVGKAMLSKSLIQFSTDGCGCVPSLSLLFSDFLWQRLTEARWGSEWRRKCYVNHNTFWVDNCTLNRDGTVVFEPLLAILWLVQRLAIKVVSLQIFAIFRIYRWFCTSE